jgi:hypothetical protein
VQFRLAAAGKLVARPAVEPHPRAVLAGNDPEAVMLDFMQPDGAGGRPWGLGGQARRDEADRQRTRTRQHRREDNSVRTNREPFRQQGAEIANF